MAYIGANSTDVLPDNIEDVTEIVGIIRTQIEVGGIRDAVYSEYRYAHKYPNNFSAFIEKIMESNDDNRDISCDYWGSPWELEKSKGEFLIRSCGPDRSCGTSDDIVAIKKNINRKSTFAR